jgi:hypothetical protein
MGDMGFGSSTRNTSWQRAVCGLENEYLPKDGSQMKAGSLNRLWDEAKWILLRYIDSNRNHV